MNDERTDFEAALDDLLQTVRFAPRTAEGQRQINAAKKAFLTVFHSPAPAVAITDAMTSLEGLADQLRGVGWSCDRAFLANNGVLRAVHIPIDLRSQEIILTVHRNGDAYLGQYWAANGMADNPIALRNPFLDSALDLIRAYQAAAQAQPGGED
jgi:hypothetical protein